MELVHIVTVENTTTNIGGSFMDNNLNNSNNLNNNENSNNNYQYYNNSNNNYQYYNNSNNNYQSNYSYNQNNNYENNNNYNLNNNYQNNDFYNGNSYNFNNNQNYNNLNSNTHYNINNKPYSTNVYDEVPETVHKWNWGAFMLPIAWGIGNKSFLCLLTCIPYIGLVMHFICGAFGNKWAYNNTRGYYDSPEEFTKAQESWNRAGFVTFIITIILLVITIAFFIFIITSIPSHKYSKSWTY